jgi:phosphoribosylanthranilate isomerase
MAYKIKVKLSGVNNLSDARYAAAVGIDYVGFCFDSANTRSIAPIKAKEIIDWISGSYTVAEFGSQSIDEIIDIADLLVVDVVELENTLLPDELKEIGKPLIKKMKIEDYPSDLLEQELKSYQQVVDAFLLYSNQVPEPYSCEYLKSLSQSFKIIWGFDISSATANNIIDSIAPYAISIVGGDEERVGVKDFDTIADILEAIEV